MSGCTVVGTVQNTKPIDVRKGEEPPAVHMKYVDDASHEVGRRASGRIRPLCCRDPEYPPTQCWPLEPGSDPGSAHHHASGTIHR